VTLQANGDARRVPGGCALHHRKRKPSPCFHETVPTPLHAVSSPALQQVRLLRSQIDQRLGELLPPPEHARDLVGVAMREGTLAPGKRLRPLLLLLAARGLGQPTGPLLDVGCALEMVHAASLFLDDLPCMDDARLRRGQPTVHVRYGEDVAMLGAVALLSHAFRVVARQSHLDPLLRTRMVVALSESVGTDGLVRGQFHDLHDGAQPRPAEAIAVANQLKTGSLFTAALDMAALAAGAGADVQAALNAFGTELGHAFQLMDDLIDAEMPTALSGKDTGQDRGKSTLVTLLGIPGARLRLGRHLEEAEASVTRALGPESDLSQLLRMIFMDQLAPAAHAA
jgi:geranylgeranyl diphosphate synthase type II